MLEIFRGIGVGKVLTFSVDERVLVSRRIDLARFWADTHNMIFRSWKAHVPFVSYLSTFNPFNTG